MIVRAPSARSGDSHFRTGRKRSRTKRLRARRVSADRRSARRRTNVTNHASPPRPLLKIGAASALRPARKRPAGAPTRSIPASAQPATSASRPKPSTGPSAPAPSRPWAAAGAAPQASDAPGELVAVDAGDLDRGELVAALVVCDRDDRRAGAGAGLGVGPAGRALDEAAGERPERRLHTGHLDDPGVDGRHPRHRLRAASEPAEVGVDLAQAGVELRQREVLGGADRDRVAARPAASNERTLGGAALGADRAVAVGERRLDQGAGERGAAFRRSSRRARRRSRSSRCRPGVAASPASRSARPAARLPGTQS